MMSEEESLQDIAPLLQNLVDYLSKLKDPNEDLFKAIEGLDKKIELLIKRTESVTVGMERLIAVIEDTFARERTARRAGQIRLRQMEIRANLAELGRPIPEQ